VVGRREEQVSPDVERDGRLRAVTPAWPRAAGTSSPPSAASSCVC